MTEAASTPVYAGFWIRFSADAVDYLIVFLLSLLLPLLHSPAYERLGWAVLSLLFVAYEVYFHLRWGQTIGMKLTKLRIRRFDLRPIDAKSAFRYSSVNLAIRVFQFFRVLTVLATLGLFEGAAITGDQIDAEMHRFLMVKGMAYVIALWPLISELALLFNLRKRTLNDYIGGTVVIRGHSPNSDKSAFNARR